MITNSLLKGKGLIKYTLILAIAGLSTVLTSCMKNNDTNPVVTDVAALSIVNLSPTSKLLNISFDAKRLNNAGIPYLQGFPYIGAATGSRTVAVSDNGTGTELAKKTISLVKDTYYSLYIVGLGTSATDSVSFVLTKDSLRTPASGKARVRFLHAAQGIAPLDLTVDGQTTSLFTNRPYKSVSDFTEIAPITGGVLVIKDKGTGAVVARLENVNIPAGNSYTIFAKGSSAATINDQKVGIQIINHSTL